MPGARCTRSPCALVGSTRSSPQAHRKSPGIPCAMVLTAYCALSPATNSFCHRRQRIKTCRSPVGPTHLRWLSISNGCQNHTPSPYAATFPKRFAWPCAACGSFGEGIEAPFVRALTNRSQVNPALRFPSRPTLPRPPHLNPRS